MTTERETTRIVRSWMAEGVDRLPDRVLDAALDRTSAIPQRRHSWSPRRLLPMPSFVRPVGAVAALAVVLVLGWQLLPFAGVGSTAPTPTPAPSPTVSPSPAPSAPAEAGPSQIPLGGSDVELLAGTYQIPDPFFAPLTLTFDASWTSSGLRPEGVFFYRTQPANFAPALLIDQAVRVFPDPCHPGAATESPAASTPPLTADQLIEALQTMEGFTAGPVTDTTVGGHPARMLTLTNDLTDEEAALCEGSPLDIWDSAFGHNVTNQRAQDQIWIVDMNGTIVTIDAQSQPGRTPESLQPELDALVASIRFDQ